MIKSSNCKKVILLTLMGICGNDTLVFADPILDPKVCLGPIINGIFNHPITWGILDNVHFHVGKTVPLKYGFEGTYGISNSIAWFPKFAKFHEHFRMGAEWHFNLIFSITNALRGLYCVEDVNDFFKILAFFHLLGNFHFFTFNFFSFLKLKLLSLGGCIAVRLGAGNEDLGAFETFNRWSPDDLNKIYLCLLPCVQLDIMNLIDFVRED